MRIEKDDAVAWILLIIVFLGMFLFEGCTKTIYVPVKGDTIVKDTTVVIEKERIVTIPVEKEAVTTPADSSHLETSIAKSDAWIDRSGLLHHTIQNKEGVQKEVKEKEIHHYHDSISYVPEPYPVTMTEYRTRGIVKVLAVLGAVFIALVGVELYSIIRRP